MVGIRMTDRIAEIRARLKAHHYPQGHATEDIKKLLERVQCLERELLEKRVGRQAPRPFGSRPRPK